MPSTQTGSTYPNNDYKVTLSPNTPTLSGYSFQGWCTSSTSSASCSGTSYNAGGSITISSNGQTINLYAKWKSTGPVYGDSCQNGAGKILKDNKCWMTTDIGSGSWNYIIDRCVLPWHLPSQAEFNTLILAYFPTATASGTGYIYSGDISSFTADWGTTSGDWWSSTEKGSGGRVYALNLSSSSVNSNSDDARRVGNKARCVSN